MISYLLRRILWLVPVILTVSVVTFFLMHRAPGGPWDANNDKLAEATRRSLNARFHLDDPIWVNREKLDARWEDGERNPLTLGRAFLDSQFFNYLAGLVRFDLGPSYQSKGTENVQDVLRERFPTSAKLGMVAVFFAMVVGLPLGIVAALRQNSWLDYLSLSVSTVGISVPTFVSGILLLIFLSSNFGVSPIRRPEEWHGFGRAYLLPGIVLGLGTMAYVVRLTRTSLLEIKRQDFVRTARAKGLREGPIVTRHMLRNALIPVITVLGPATADLITGSFIIEKIYNVPGLGREFFESISRRDYSMIMGTTLLYAVLIAVANVVVDISYGLIDPRIRARQ
ncbi:MAG TPA: ABC transporter permease [Thermomicrobiales bacterium]|nr:ABC transporter permease [Thermomicrobiales bacterium]